MKEKVTYQLTSKVFCNILTFINIKRGHGLDIKVSIGGDLVTHACVSIIEAPTSRSSSPTPEGASAALEPVPLHSLIVIIIREDLGWQLVI